MPVLRSSHPKGFTVLELIVAVTVTAMLSGMLLLISNQVLETQSRASAELEHNQIAHFVLDQIQEDLQCALSAMTAMYGWLSDYWKTKVIAVHG